MFQRAGQAPGLQGEIDLFAVLIHRQAIEVGGHKVDVLFGQQRRAGEAAHGRRAIGQQVAVPRPEVEKGVEALVVIGVEILHILRRAAAVDDVFKRLRGDGVGGKTQHQRAGQRRQRSGEVHGISAPCYQ